MRLRTTFLWSMVLSLGLAAALGVGAIIFDGLGRGTERILITALLVGGFSLTCLASAVVLDRRRLVAVMWIGIGSSLSALAVWLGMVWLDIWRWSDPWDELVLRFGVTFTVLCVWAGHLGLLQLPTLALHAWRNVRRATLILAVLLAVEIVAATWLDAWRWRHPWDDAVEKSIAILSILVACGTVVTPILGLIGLVLDRDAPSVLGSRVSVALTCPRCHLEQEIPVGRGRCSRCGLRITIGVDEPRCSCGYLVYRLEGEVCPECGRAVPAELRWDRTPETEST